MSETAEHYCTGCGQQHGGGDRTDPAVEIARINAKRDVEIARMEYREAQELAAVEADTAVVTTELETAAEVAVAEATDPPPADDAGDENQSIIVEGPPAEPDGDGDEPTLEPKEETMPAPAASKSRGYWG